MSQMQQQAMGDPRGASASAGSGNMMGTMPIMGGMVGAGVGMGMGLASGTAVGASSSGQSLQSSLAGEAAIGGNGNAGGGVPLSVGGGTGGLGMVAGSQQQGTMTASTTQPIPALRTAQDAQMAVKELREKLQWMPST